MLFTYIVKYSWEIILPFIKSLIRINLINCDIIIFVNQVTQTVMNNLKSYGLKFYEIKVKLNNAYEIYQYRWKLYRDYLNENESKYNIVLSVDVRDTIFQKDFFHLYENSGSFIGFSYESATLIQLIHKEWIINTFGNETFKIIENKRTVNAGTIWGTSDNFLRFINIFCNKLSYLS